MGFVVMNQLGIHEYRWFTWVHTSSPETTEVLAFHYAFFEALQWRTKITYLKGDAKVLIEEFLILSIESSKP